jgi:hypothetical protein
MIGLPIESAYQETPCKQAFFGCARSSLRWRFRRAVNIAMHDEVAEPSVL